MFSILKLPAKVIGILEARITPKEIALGVCLGMFLGFTPLNGTTAFLLAIFFFVFKINRMSTLLTLPAFKALYLLGVSKAGDFIGLYFLEKANYLTGFWRFITNLPVFAYLDINRTTVAGGVILSLILSIPVYFISKKISSQLLAKYSQKMQTSAFAVWVRSVYHVSNIIGPDAGAVIGNVKAVAKSTIVSKIKSAIIKPRAKADKTGIMKRINVTGIAIIAIALVLIQFGLGLIISPIFGSAIIGTLNEGCGTKITVEKINIWPLTLSFSMKGLKIFDPQNTEKRIVAVETASMRISPLALLSRRFVFSSVNMKGADIDLEGEPDGSFNIQRLSRKGAEAGKDESYTGFAGLWKTGVEKKDLFGNIFSAIKKRFSKSGKEEEKNRKKVTRTVQELPKGKLITFRTGADAYQFEIKEMNMDGRINIVPAGAESIEVKNARIGLKRLAFDQQNGTRMDGIDIRGEFFRNNTAAGRMALWYLRKYEFKVQKAEYKIELKDVDLEAIRFIYQDSLPVEAVKGKVSLASNTRINGGVIDSRSSITLMSHTLKPKGGSPMVVGFIPIATVCDALNRIDPVKLKIEIRGTVDKPEFVGFQDMIISLVKPYVANIGEQVKAQGMNALGKLLQNGATQGQTSTAASGASANSVSTEQAVESIKSLFGNKSKE